MDYEKLFPGRFLKSAEMDGRDWTLEIKGIRSEEIDGKPKAILSFNGTKKEVVMNRTNAEALKLMFGRETNDWIGKRVTLFPATIADPFNGGTTKAIRVRGSPDISKPASAEVQRGRKTIKVQVVPTAVRKAGAQRAPPPPEPPRQEPPPPHDEQTGEVFDGPPGESNEDIPF